MRRALVWWVGLVLVASLAQAGPLTPELKAKLEKAGPEEKVSCLVYMKQAYPFEALAGQPVKERIHTFQRIAKESQAPVLDYLRSRPQEAEVKQTFWVMNGFHLEATPGAILALARREDVAWISHNGEVHLVDEILPSPALASVLTTEWNISKIKADSCWAAGFTGQGIVIGETDTGVDYTHPALQGKWSGYWHDAINDSTHPYDDHNHGTHCMGTIMGGDGPGPFADDIGVAFNARFAAAKVLNSGGSGTDAQCVEGLQFIADLKESVDVKAVSNSWAGSRSDTFCYPVCRTLRAVGILPVFANGNSGPAPRTVQAPGDFAVTVGVGATTVADTMAGFSSRGPAPDSAPWNNPSDWYRPDWNLIKPNLSAPGANIRSSIPGGLYASWNGTSMATPHVAGAVAILCEKNPRLTPTDLYNFLLDNVDQPSGGGPYPNNNYGWGRLNVWKALQATPRPTDPYIRIESTRFNAPPDPGATVNFFVTVRNRGADANNLTGRLSTPDPDVTITDAQGSYGNVPTDSIRENTGDPFVLQVRRGMRYHEVIFALALTANGGAWNDTLEVKAAIGYPPPNVIYVSCTVDDPNHNGRIEPGETANVVVTVSNNGQQDARNVASTLSTAEPGLRVIQPNAPYGDIPIGQQRSNSGTPFVVNCLPYVRMKNAQFTLTLNGTGSRDSLSWIWTPAFTIPVGSSQLLVVNADPGGNFLNYYTAPLDTLGVEYGYHTTTASAVRDTDLAKHVQVIWYTGNDTVNCLTDVQKTLLSNYLNLHGNVFVTGKGIAGNLNRRHTSQDSLFLRNILHATYNTNHTNNFWFTGVTGDPIGNGITMLGFGRANNQNPFNVVNAVNSGIVSLNHQSVPAMVRYEWPDGHREVFFSAGYEGVGTDPFSVGPSAFLKRILDWLYAPPPAGVEEGKPVAAVLPLTFALGPARPNPFTGQVAISYSLPVAAQVNLRVFNLAGQVVQTLVDGREQPGFKNVSWNGKDGSGRALSSGVYFYRLEAGAYSATRKAVFLR